MEKNFGNKINTKGFDKNPQNINRKGAPLSFKAKYKEIYQTEQGIIWVDASLVAEREKNGKKQFGLSLAKAEQILAKLDRLIMTAKNDRTSLDAIKFIWEQIDGKPNQTIDTTIENKVIPITLKID